MPLKITIYKSSFRFSACGIFTAPPPLKLRHFFTHNISKNRHMKYNIFVSRYAQKRWWTLLLYGSFPFLTVVSSESIPSSRGIFVT